MRDRIGQAAAALRAWLAPPRRRRASFMHLEKTGGTSVQEFLRERYPADQVVQQPGFDTDSAQRLRSDPQARARELLIGHYDLPFLHAFDPERMVFTFLREPRARILSLYYYWRAWRRSHDGTEPNPAAVAAARLGLAAFLDCPMPEVRNAIDNFYARRLTGLSVTPQGDALDRVDAAQAAMCLARLGFVGLTERMQESLQLLSQVLHVAPPTVTPRVNISADMVQAHQDAFAPVERETITPGIEQALDRLTSIDRSLYASAQARFD